MSERKAINKYYPPDWDPAKVPKKKKNTNPNAEKVRLMAPFSMKCLQCLEYISARRKFNARKEITNEKYMGIKIIRFHIKCPRCNHALLFQTDPKSAGFAPVAGCTRNYESTSTVEAIKPLETEDEILERLERQEREDQQYQEQQRRRKNNPFWQHQTHDPSKDVMSNLEDKLLEQKREQEVHDHLVYLQAKATKLQESGGPDLLVKQAQEMLRLDSARDREHKEGTARPGPPKKPRLADGFEARGPTTVPKSFTARKTNLKRQMPHASMATVPMAATEPRLGKQESHQQQPVRPVSVFGDYESSAEDE